MSPVRSRTVHAPATGRARTRAVRSRDNRSMGNHEFCPNCGESTFHSDRPCDPEKVKEYQAQRASLPGLVPSDDEIPPGIDFSQGVRGKYVAGLPDTELQVIVNAKLLAILR